MRNVDGPAVRLVDETDTVLAEVLPDALAIMNEQAGALCGAWNAHDLERSHERGGTTTTSVVMGGQRLAIRRPRVHAVDENGDRAGEAGLASYGVFAQGDLLSQVAVERMLAGVATRGFERAADPIGAKNRQAVTRRFIVDGAAPRATPIGTTRSPTVDTRRACHSSQSNTSDGTSSSQLIPASSQNRPNDTRSNALPRTVAAE